MSPVPLAPEFVNEVETRVRRIVGDEADDLSVELVRQAVTTEIKRRAAFHEFLDQATT